jgi:DNA (cytosine-5)-methyltransferase 1
VTRPTRNDGADLHARLTDALNAALAKAEATFATGVADQYGLSESLVESLTQLSAKAQRASAAFTAIITCLAIKVFKPSADIRYHQTQIQKDTSRPAGFNFRGPSEATIYPWLDSQMFDGAKSGWQTRTLERPVPYKLDYSENIAEVKEPFLRVFDEIEEQKQSAGDALAYLIYLQLIHRESKKLTLSKPRTADISLIVELLSAHFFHVYKESRGASRLPVLALYAIYSVLTEQLARFNGMELKPLEEHSAADSQTGALGDIEVIDTGTREVFEAIEVKHGMPITEAVIRTAMSKIMDKRIDRYYVLTTHVPCELAPELMPLLTKTRDLYGCQLIANGVIPSLRYYLRMLSDPSLVLPRYVELLATDSAVKHEHREVWNSIATGS